MEKMDIIHLHRLMDIARKSLTEELPEDIEIDPIFREYENLDVDPQNITENKSNQKEAVLELGSSLSELNVFANLAKYSGEEIDDLKDKEDEELVRFGGEILSENNVSRPEAAEKLSRAVEFNSRTVYDKFTDYGITFTLHGQENRNSALEELRSYAEENIERSKALKQVSESYGVPEGTLKNWLTDEQITFTENVSVLLESDSQEELIETAEHYFDFRSDAKPMEQALGRDRDTLRLYKEGEIDTMPVELLERLDALFDSEPRYRLDDPERYVKEVNGRGVVVEDDFQAFLFSHVSTNEFTEMTGSSRTSYSRYTQNKTKFVDEEAYRKVFQTVSHMYDKHPEPDIEAFVDRNSYATSSGDSEKSVLDPEDVSDELQTLT